MNNDEKTEEDLGYTPVLSKRFTSFAGVYRRDEFWWDSFRLIAYGLIVMFVVVAWYMFVSSLNEIVGGVSSIILITILEIKFSIIPSYRILTKRLHAFGKSATYWLLIPNVFYIVILPCIEIVIGLIIDENRLFCIFVLSEIINFAFFLYFLYLIILCAFCKAKIDKVSPIKNSIGEMIGKTKTKKRVIKKARPVASDTPSVIYVEPTMPVKPVMPVKPEMPVKPVMPVKPEMPVKPVMPVKPEMPVKPIHANSTGAASGRIKMKYEPENDKDAPVTQNRENELTCRKSQSRFINSKGSLIIVLSILMLMSIIVTYVVCGGLGTANQLVHQMDCAHSHLSNNEDNILEHEVHEMENIENRDDAEENPEQGNAAASYHLEKCDFNRASSSSTDKEFDLSTCDSTLPERYLVLPGDTWYSIAAKYSIKEYQLKAANRELASRISLPAYSYVNVPISQEMKVNQAESSVASKTAKYHVVKQGENLGRIARKYKISLAKLLKLNNMTEQDARRLKEGVRLKVSD